MNWRSFDFIQQKREYAHILGELQGRFILFNPFRLLYLTITPKIGFSSLVGEPVKVHDGFRRKPESRGRAEIITPENEKALGWILKS
jgi:hypothetical protein